MALKPKTAHEIGQEKLDQLTYMDWDGLIRSTREKFSEVRLLAEQLEEETGWGIEYFIRDSKPPEITLFLKRPAPQKGTFSGIESAIFPLDELLQHFFNLGLVKNRRSWLAGGKIKIVLRVNYADFIWLPCGSEK